MKTIKIFIASSNELTPEREKFDTLFGHINNIFEARGIQLKAVKWEFLDSSMGKEHKQEEYNREIRDCDICVVMFWQCFGEFTNTELKVADTELRAGRKPSKIYVFFKEPGDITEEMLAFKKTFESEYGHFYCKFDCIDKLQLDFVLQLERFLNSNLVKVENSQVTLDNVPVAHLDNIGFAAGNEKYRTLRERLKNLETEITQLETVYQAMPNETIKAMLNSKKRERTQLRVELSEHEQILLSSAVNIAHFARERISERMKRAVALFEEGKVSEANTILDEAEKNADDILRGVREIKAVGKDTVEELMLRASTMIADERYTIDERITKVEAIYAKADELAQECNLEDKKYNKLLFEYASFLHKYAKYNKAVEVYTREISLIERLYGLEHPDTATSYNNIGLVYKDLGDYDKALEYYFKALPIRKKVLGIEHPDTATSHNNIGSVYYSLGDNEKALEYHFKALSIRKKILGIEHPDTAKSYNDIGCDYYSLGDYDKALEYLSKALSIHKKLLIENPDTAKSYSNIGSVYNSLGDNEKALEYHFKTLSIRKKVLGIKHPDTAKSYSNIGYTYNNIGDYNKALEDYIKAFLKEKGLDVEPPYTAISYDNIDYTSNSLGDYNRALEYYFKALAISEKVLGTEHPSTKIEKENIEYIKSKIHEQQ